MKRIRSLIFNGVKYYGIPLCGYENNMGNKIEYGIPDQILEEAWRSQRWDDTRAYRDKLVAETDYTQVSDSPLPIEKKAEFTAYRQALRDIPQTYDNPDDIVWPTKPTI